MLDGHGRERARLKRRAAKLKAMTPEQWGEYRVKLQLKLERRNAAFNMLSPERKRVKIAKDVVAQLRAGKLTARAGQYIDVWNGWETESVAQSLLGPNPDMRETLELTGSKCEVCALGAVFTCAVKIRNAIEFDEGNNARWHRMHRYLGDIFSMDQMRLMESAFERNEKEFQYRHDRNTNLPIPTELAQKDYDRAAQFGRNYLPDADRLEAIMLNIIANNGEFKP